MHSSGGAVHPEGPAQQGVRRWQQLLHRRLGAGSCSIEDDRAGAVRAGSCSSENDRAGAVEACNQQQKARSAGTVIA